MDVLEKMLSGTTFCVVACAHLALVACSSGSSNGSGGAPGVDASSDAQQPVESGADAGLDATPKPDATQADAGTNCDEKSKNCATQFGSLFTKSNGRADGTLVALVRPTDQQCTLPNGTHVVLQLSMQGQVQRLVASVDGVATAVKSAPLIGPPYAEGWHENVSMEYVPDLGVHSGDFTDATLDEAVAFICAHTKIGAPMSIFAYSDGSAPSSAHQIHSNDNYPDGAIVIDPTSTSPTYLLFRYLDQVF